jgi:hypothetical protein
MKITPYEGLESGSSKERRLEEGDPGGHRPKTGRRAVEDEGVNDGKIILNGTACFVF